eukprot:6205970-Pleurochrysis_carterae.AAC.2
MGVSVALTVMEITAGIYLVVAESITRHNAPTYGVPNVVELLYALFQHSYIYNSITIPLCYKKALW